VRSRIRQKRAFRGSRGQTGSRSMAATCFFDSATPTFDLSKSRPKYTTISFGRLPAIRQPHEPEYGGNERFGGSRAQTGSRNMAATRFSDSATPTFGLSVPKNPGKPADFQTRKPGFVCGQKPGFDGFKFRVPVLQRTGGYGL